MNNELPLVLVVEDVPNLLHGICDVLEAAGFEILSASDGSEALQILQDATRLPNVIVSDVQMPFIDGYELLHRVRQEPDWLEIPFIFLTAYTDQQEVRKGMVAGVDDYLTKPFTPEMLIDTINGKLRRHNQLAQARSLQIKHIKHDILNILNHEFRTPLTPIVAYSDMLNSNVDQMTREELTLYIAEIQTGTRRLRQLIEDFMLLVELETGSAHEAFQSELTPIDNLTTILETVQLFKTEDALNLKIALSVEPLPDYFPIFNAAPTYLQGAVMRLVDNAIKFTDHPARSITVSARANERFAMISVTDEGRGIPPTDTEAIFDPFYQINRKHYEDQGTGSGLPIVRGIMALHGGHVGVESTHGEGSTFTLYFPLD